MMKRQRILFAPLDWGLGHATRCIPLIRKELDTGNEVILAASGRSASLLRKAFPTIGVHAIPDYGVHYPSKGWLLGRLILQVPAIMKAIRAEHVWLDEFLKREQIDLVVSDNRYGMYSRRTRSVIITHQLFPVVPPLLSGITRRLVMRHLSRFDEVWIPDYPGEENLSGTLCHGKLPLHARFIGPLSRFPADSPVTRPTNAPRALALVSGPEPQRTIFLEQLREVLSALPMNSWIAEGSPESDAIRQEGALTIFPHLSDEQFTEAIRLADVIICRSGYTTLMDLHTLGRDAWLVPTPGQTEQEYLAHHFSSKYAWQVIPQEDIVRELPERLAEHLAKSPSSHPHGTLR